MQEIPTDWLRASAARRPDAVALADGHGGQLTYAALEAEAANLAAVIERDCPADGLCAIELEPGLGHARAVHAALLAGRPFQTLRPDLPAAARAAALQGVAQPLLITEAWLEASAGAAHGSDPGRRPRPAPDAQATAVRVLTSGTAGEPRVIPLTYSNLFWSAAASAHNLGVEPSDRWLCCLPVDHVGGLSILIRSAIYGTTALVHSRFDAERVAAALNSGEVTMVSLVPTQLRRLLDLGAEIERARVVLLGGGPVPRGLLDSALDQGANVIQTYGLTEAASQVCALPPEDASRKRGSVGKPLLNVELGIDNGEILVAGPMVSPQAGALLRTGDLGRFDDEGYLWIEGRSDDLIVSGGENVSPAAVEDVLLVHPAVADVAVVGRPDEEWGQAVTAVVVPRGEPPAAGDLREHCESVLAAHQVPKRFEFTDQLPRTASGKLLRRALR